MMQEHQNG